MISVFIVLFHEGSARTIIIEACASARQTWRGRCEVENGSNQPAPRTLNLLIESVRLSRSSTGFARKAYGRFTAPI
jgi:hypothetical protein